MQITLQSLKIFLALTVLALPSATLAVGGSGTTNYVSKWVGSANIGDSLIYDTGTNVGISTTTPDRKLTVKVPTGVNDIARFRTDNGNADLVISAAADKIASIYTLAGQGLSFGTNQGAERMRITSDGNVGIGTAAPARKLSVTVPSGVNDIAHFRSDNARSDLIISGAADKVASIYTLSGQGLSIGTNGGVEAMRFTSGGNVGIGTSSPTRKLHVITSEIADDSQAIRGSEDATGNYITYGIVGVTKANGKTNYNDCNGDGTPDCGGGSPVGVMGISEATSVQGAGSFGVLGKTYRTDNNLGSYSAGVWGGAPGTNDKVYGSHNALANGVQGETWSTNNLAAGGVFIANTGDTGKADGVVGQTKSKSGDSFGVFSSGKLGYSSIQTAVVNTLSQGPVELYTSNNTEAWFEDYGEAKLENGKVHIELDSIFRQNVIIDDIHPYQVFIQTYDNLSSETLNVHKENKYFEVSSIDNNDSNLKFSYRIAAKRKYYENIRMNPVKVKIDQFMEPNLNAYQREELNKKFNLLNN